MKWVTNIVLLLLVIVFIGAGVLLRVDNPDPVSVRFLNFESPSIPVFWWLLGSLLAGVGVGFALAFVGFLRGKYTERQLRRELNLNKEELHRIRTLSLHD